MNGRKDGMTMKKTLALILALVLALSALGALAAGKSIPIDRARFRTNTCAASSSMTST